MARPEMTGRKSGLVRKAAAPSDVLAYTVPEAGRLLGISRNSAYDAAARGEIPIVRIGGRLIVPRVALERLLAGAGKPEIAA